jgi:signal transduction histidine kinase
VTAAGADHGQASASREVPAAGRGGHSDAEPLDAPGLDRIDGLLDVLAAASLGDLGSRVEVSPDALEEPLDLVANAINMLLDDLAYRQREREEALRRVAAAEAKEEFLASLSHDMQTPLAIILGAVHVLDATNAPEHLGSTLPLMRAAAHRLQRFVQQFLDLARFEAHEALAVRVVPMDVGEVVDRTVSLFVEYEPIGVELPADLPAVLGDPQRVEQILANLLSNAFGYASAPTVRARAECSTVLIEVADRGGGMTEAELDRAFAKFGRVNRGRTPSGTGLGLFISRAMAEAQGGRLTGRSEPGVGSWFTLQLPTAAGTPDGSAARPFADT